MEVTMMAKSVSEIIFKMIADATGMKSGADEAIGAIDKTESKMSKFNQGMKNFGAGMMDAGKKMMLGITTPLVGIGVGMIKAASDAEEMRGKFSVVFDGMENEMRAFAAESSKSWGRSQLDIEGYLAESQNMLVGMGMTREAGADLSKQIVQMGIDLASFNNLSESDALRNLQSAISGNHNAAQSLGAVLNENTLALAMNEMGLEGKFQALTEAEKMEVRYHAIMMQSTDAMGDAERTSGSFANQLRRLWGNVKDTSASFGTLLLPTATAVIEKLNVLAGWVANLNENQMTWILILGTLLAAIGPVVFIIGALAFAIGTVGAPVAALIAGITALIGILVGAYTTSETFRDTINGAFRSVRDFFLSGVQAIRQYWDENGEAILQRAMDTFFSVRDIVLNVLGIVVSFIQEKLEQIKQFWDENGAQILQAVQNVFSGIWSVIQFIMPAILWLVESIWGNIKGVFSGTLNIIMGLIKVFAGLFTGDWSKLWEGVKQLINGALQFIWNLANLMFLGRIVGIIRGFSSTGIGIIRSFTTNIRNFFSNMRDSVVAIFNRIRDAIVGAFTSARGRSESIVNTMRAALNATFTSIKRIATSTFNRVRDAIVNPIQRARDLVKSAVDNIVGFFSGLGSKLSFSIPRPKLPKFSIKGSFDITKFPPSVPSFGIDWYAKGAVFTKPTIFNTPFGLKGFGEAGPEAALPLTDNVLGAIGGAIARLMPTNSGGSNRPIHITIEHTTKLDGREVARETHEYVTEYQERDKKRKKAFERG